jgi:hypothetical protein
MLLVDNRSEEISADRVRRVNRIGHQAKKGAMIGLLVGVGTGVASLAGEDGEGWGVVVGAFAGTLWGGLIGWAIPSRTPVYEPGLQPHAASLQIVPVVTPTQAGFALSIGF